MTQEALKLAFEAFQYVVTPSGGTRAYVWDSSEARLVADAYRALEKALAQPKESTNIERHEANEDLFKAFFNQPDFQRMMTRALSMSLYNHFNPPKDGVISGKTHRLPDGSKVPTI